LGGRKLGQQGVAEGRVGEGGRTRLAVLDGRCPEALGPALHVPDEQVVQNQGHVAQQLVVRLDTRLGQVVGELREVGEARPRSLRHAVHVHLDPQGAVGVALAQQRGHHTRVERVLQVLLGHEERCPGDHVFQEQRVWLQQQRAQV
jgi:hypothetical protein